MFDLKDCKFEMYPKPVEGGMQTGKMPTGIKAIHVPTGLAVICNSERDQYRNRETAIKKLEVLVNNFVK